MPKISSTEVTLEVRRTDRPAREDNGKDAAEEEESKGDPAQKGRFTARLGNEKKHLNGSTLHELMASAGAKFGLGQDEFMLTMLFGDT